MSSLAQVATIDLNKTERVRKSNTVAWQKRVINVANILFVLIWAASSNRRSAGYTCHNCPYNRSDMCGLGGTYNSVR